MSSQDDQNENENENVSRTADEQALAALFASLVADSPASEVSPEAVIERANNEHNSALDRRIKRLKLGRNLLLAAALAALVALVVPKLGNSSSEVSAASSAAPSISAAASSSAAAAAGSAAAGTSAAGSAAAAAPEAASAPASALASGIAAASSAPAASAAAAASAGGADSATQPMSSAAASAAATAATSAASASSAAAPASKVPPASTSRCALLPAKAIAAARRALATAGFDGTAPLADCATYGVLLTGPAGNHVGIGVSRAAPGACRRSTSGCVAVPGEPGVYQAGNTTSNYSGPVWVYGNGYEVVVSSVDHAVSTQTRIDVGRAVIKALG